MSKPKFFTVLRNGVACDMVFAESWVITGGALVFYKNAAKGFACGPTYWHSVRQSAEWELRDRLADLQRTRDPEPAIVEQIEWLRKELYTEMGAENGSK